jgi:hypothetical protein
MDAMNIDEQKFLERLRTLGLGADWRWDKGSWWRDAGDAFDLRDYTGCMLAARARFVAITATELENKEIRLDYQWDLDGQLLSLTTATIQQTIPSIVDLCPAADWVERETREYFAVVFTGRETTDPLMMRANSEPGLHLRKEVAQ